LKGIAINFTGLSTTLFYDNDITYAVEIIAICGTANADVNTLHMHKSSAFGKDFMKLN